MKALKITLVVAFVFAVAYLLGCFHKENKKAEVVNTELRVVNESGYDSVLVYLTLSGYSDTALYVQNVNGIFGITQSGLQGSFYLRNTDSVSYTSLKYLSGNISFGTPPLNCLTEQWPTGMNLFEFNLNEPQESIDISCMAGVNSLMKVDLINGPSWPASTMYPDPRVLENDSMYKNTYRVGVYPYGCTNCINTAGKQDCQTPSETPDTMNICNPTRAKGGRGGIVRVAFKGYTNIEICK